MDYHLTDISTNEVLTISFDSSSQLGTTQKLKVSTESSHGKLRRSCAMLFTMDSSADLEGEEEKKCIRWSADS